MTPSKFAVVLQCDVGRRVVGLDRRGLEEKRKMFVFRLKSSSWHWGGARPPSEGISQMTLEMLCSPDLAQGGSQWESQSLQAWLSQMG